MFIRTGIPAPFTNNKQQQQKRKKRLNKENKIKQTEDLKYKSIS